MKRIQPLLAQKATSAISKALKVSWVYAKYIRLGPASPASSALAGPRAIGRRFGVGESVNLLTGAKITTAKTSYIRAVLLQGRGPGRSA